MDLNEITKMYDFTGRTIVVTGGTGVLGGEMACALAGCGANVAIIDRNPAMADRFKARFEAAAGRVLVIESDVVYPERLKQAARQVMETFGGVYGLINAAGGNYPQATTSPDQPFFDLLPEALRFTFDLNILGAVFACQIFGRIMVEQGEGAIVNISSISSDRPITRVSMYSAAKAGVNNFTRWLAVYVTQAYGPNIRVNAIAPGFFLTEQNRFLLIDRDTGALTPRGQKVTEHTPMARFGQPAELVGAAFWLLSPASAFVTGAVIAVDGGFAAFSGV